jgi:hypothetical protein
MIPAVCARAQDVNLSEAVVMMLSSCDLPEGAARCRGLGISRYLVKPIMQADLLDAILGDTRVGRRTKAGCPLRSVLPRDTVDRSKRRPGQTG